MARKISAPEQMIGMLPAGEIAHKFPNIQTNEFSSEDIDERVMHSLRRAYGDDYL
ncbi:hypothetical protein [Altererythrobacter sp. GH1-8]|uniref:hypothetical protein n=1 Tax=Altererythrobacter sp. GH1-8 TaxID=3349333 RepID=UPI00374D18EC